MYNFYLHSDLHGTLVYVHWKVVFVATMSSFALYQISCFIYILVFWVRWLCSWSESLCLFFWQGTGLGKLRVSTESVASEESLLCLFWPLNDVGSFLMDACIESRRAVSIAASVALWLNLELAAAKARSLSSFVLRGFEAKACWYLRRAFVERIFWYTRLGRDLSSSPRSEGSTRRLVELEVSESVDCSLDLAKIVLVSIDMASNSAILQYVLDLSSGVILQSIGWTVTLGLNLTRVLVGLMVLLFSALRCTGIDSMVPGYCCWLGIIFTVEIIVVNENELLAFLFLLRPF